MSTWTYTNIKGQSHSLTLVQGHSASTFSNFFSWETARPLEAKFHVEPRWDGGTKVCSNGHGQITKVAAMLIYGKNIHQYLDWHIICRSTYSMSINIHTMYSDRHTVCQLTYCMSIEIHPCMYADRHTVCWMTYSISTDIHGVYVDLHTVCQSTYYMSIEIHVLYVKRLLCLMG